MQIQGGCHCGNISFVLRLQVGPGGISARACACSFCVKHGGIWTASPMGVLRVRVREPRHVSRYTFDTKTAEFHICSRCGIVPLVTCAIEGRLFAVVSVNALDGVDPALLRRGSADFDGEHADARLARRERNWIGDVEIASDRG